MSARDVDISTGSNTKVNTHPQGLLGPTRAKLLSRSLQTSFATLTWQRRPKNTQPRTFSQKLSEKETQSRGRMLKHYPSPYQGPQVGKASTYSEHTEASHRRVHVKHNTEWESRRPNFLPHSLHLTFSSTLQRIPQPRTVTSWDARGRRFW